MSTLEIVMPLGVGAPGTPVPELLSKSIESIDCDCDLTIAADTNISDECKAIIQPYHVKWYEPHSYFRKGGIWKKIFDVWKETTADYVAFCHYDDVWEFDKPHEQTSFIRANNLDGCWCETYCIDEHDNITSGDLSLPELTAHSVWNCTPAFSHSIIVRRSAILNSGILDYEDVWAANFESLFALFIHKIKNVKKCPGAKFYWRNHSLNISSTVTESAAFVREQRKATGYTLEETMKDAGRDEFSLAKIIKEVQALYP